MALCLLASWFLIFICVVKGVRSVGKAVYVTATLPYVILTVLLIRGLTLPGGTDGAVFYITPNFSKLLEIQVWLEACLQVFYSLGPAWGCIITMSSYTKFNTNCLRNAIVCTFLCEGTSMYAGLVVFTILGYMSHEASVPITEVVSSGPGLGFVIYPEALAHLPVPQLWSFIFFVMIILLAMDSLFSQVETFMTAILDEYHNLVKWRIPIAAVYCLVSFLLGLVMTTEGGIYVFQLVDWYIVALFITFAALLECVMVSWLYGIDRFSDDIQLMIGRPAPLFFKITWCYITPAMLLMTVVFTFAQYKSPTYGEYVYPYYSTVIGWIIASIPLMPVIIMMFLALYRRKGGVFQRIKMSLKPDDTWGPSEPSYRAEYIKKHRRSSTLKSAFKSSISWKGLSGKCSHIIGLTKTLHGFKLHNFKEIPSDLSSTSMPKQWNKPRGDKILPVPISQVVVARPTEQRKRKPIQCHTDMNYKLPRVDMASLQTPQGTPLLHRTAQHDLPWVQTPMGDVPIGSYQIKNATPTSHICGNTSVILPPPVKLPQEFAHLNDEDTICKDPKSLEMKTQSQSNELWFDERRKRLTASSFGKVLSRKKDQIMAS
ncbi:sodium- and chloride-dependent glycine transporter 2-like [Haliotis rubra]|uniref:sodium- and chloride-dependent glycine transporter 2-like n=1 Tax=Haliotis rubra TaxID=36100 RepID=UPI001EE52B30|nr:sodium- and chloride-dependent glycine transporter 2-like [Haliotis rubra]